jgi:hypothetical protein
MATFRVNFNKDAKMHLIAGDNSGFRPNFDYIQFKNGFMYATDAHVLVKNKISECSNFEPEQIALLEGKFIHRMDYKELLRANFVTIEADGFLIRNNERRMKIYFAPDRENYFDCDKLFKDETKEVSKIGIRADFITRISKALYCDLGYEFKFNGGTNGIVVKNANGSEESRALIMPIQING